MGESATHQHNRNAFVQHKPTRVASHSQTSFGVKQANNAVTGLCAGLASMVKFCRVLARALGRGLAAVGLAQAPDCQSYKELRTLLFSLTTWPLWRSCAEVCGLRPGSDPLATARSLQWAASPPTIAASQGALLCSYFLTDRALHVLERQRLTKHIACFVCLLF